MMFDAPAFVAQRAVMALLWRKPTTALSKTSAETATDPFVQDRRRNRAFIIHHTPTPEHGQNLTERHHHKSRLMNSIPPANSTNQSDGNVSTPMTLIPFLAVLGSIVGLTLVVLIFFTIRLRYHHRQSRRDVEAAKSKKREIVDLQTLNNASPSQKYEAVKGLKKQATWASTQSSSAEVCAICIEVIMDQDDVRRLKCKHVFHMSCIDSWFQNHHDDCPLCKSIFIPSSHGNTENVR